MPLSGPVAYAAFLQAQGSARAALEAAFEQTKPESLPSPPQQTDLIARDLAELAGSAVTPCKPVLLQTQHHALGAAWVVAGSSMGNRAMLAKRRKAGLSQANAFFSDEKMPAYFSVLIPVVERPRSTEAQQAVLKGATLAFELFLATFERQTRKAAA